MEETEILQSQCWKKAIYCFGTAYIFECRARRLRLGLRIIEFLGIIVPLFVGGIVTTYGIQFKHIQAILLLGGIVALAQLFTSVWALVSKWDDEYSYAQESISANHDLSARYRRFGENPPPRLEDFRMEVRFLDAEDSRRFDRDYRHGISDQKKRKGMRAGLRSFGRECDGCKAIPKSMKPSQCPVCGDF